MAGRSPDRFGTWILQGQDGLHSKLGREIGCRCKPSVVSKIPSLTGVHGHVVAATLAEMQDVHGSACFENCEIEFRYSKCIRQGGVEAPAVL